MLGTLVACAVGEKPPANAPAHSLAPMSLATAPPEPPPPPPPQDGATSMTENTMPKDCAQSGSAV